MTLNDSWGFHRGDHNWKSPAAVIDLLQACAAGRGNLLLNIGPRGDGSIPEQSVRVLEQVGDWLRVNGECIYDMDQFTFGMYEREGSRSDWSHHGQFTAKGNSLYWLIRRWCGENPTFAGLECRVNAATLLATKQKVAFKQTDGRVQLSGLPVNPPDPYCTVIRFDCDKPPSLYLTGGMRVPRVAHPHYDPCPSDIQH